MFNFNIWKFFIANCFNGYEETEEKNFYAVYREVFEKIKYEEEQAYMYHPDDEIASQEFVKPPGFGDANTGIEYVAEFYRFWASMNTYKSFSYADEVFILF